MTTSHGQFVNEVGLERLSDIKRCYATTIVQLFAERGRLIHLMIERPERQVEEFVRAGADSLTVQSGGYLITQGTSTDLGDAAGAYLAATGADHPMREQVVASQPSDWRDVVPALLADPPHRRRVFYQKHMTHHMLPGFGLDWMKQCTNAFLIRDPESGETANERESRSRSYNEIPT